MSCNMLMLIKYLFCSVILNGRLSNEQPCPEHYCWSLSSAYLPVIIVCFPQRMVSCPIVSSCLWWSAVWCEDSRNPRISASLSSSTLSGLALNLKQRASLTKSTKIVKGSLWGASICKPGLMHVHKVLSHFSLCGLHFSPQLDFS